MRPDIDLTKVHDPIPNSQHHDINWNNGEELMTMMKMQKYVKIC